jgi:superfamily I DNA/RNA helicase
LARKGIDFTDMIFLPVANNWIRPQYDMVVVDEAQDMNTCQLAIAQGLARNRVVVVGDDRQAIYGFRGADSGSLDRLKDELKATELGLTTTYRCGRGIVALAQTWCQITRLTPAIRPAQWWDFRRLSSLRGRIDDLFERNSRGECVVFSSVHKAKGREWEEVFVLADTLRSGGEEDNIAYVAYTRAKSRLTLVD